MVGWMLFGLGILVLGAGVYAKSVLAQQERAQAELLARQATALEQARRQLLASRQPSPLDAVYSSLEPRLREPWLPVLRRIETVTKPPIHLLKLSIDGSKGEVRIEAEAPSLDAAIEYIDSMSDGTSLRDSVLVRHEQIMFGAGDSRTRFAATAQWSSK
jgi:hypothetical protein